MSQKSLKKLRGICWKKLRTLNVVQISINYKLRSFNIVQRGFIESLSFMLPGFLSQIMGEVSYLYFNIQGAGLELSSIAAILRFWNQIL